RAQDIFEHRESDIFGGHISVPPFDAGISAPALVVVAVQQVEDRYHIAVDYRVVRIPVPYIADQIADVPALRQLGRMRDQDERAHRPGNRHIDQPWIIGELHDLVTGPAVEHRGHDDRVLLPALV